jgi:hypothetical protein
MEQGERDVNHEAHERSLEDYVYEEEDSFTRIRELSEKNKPSILQYIRAFLSLSLSLKLKFILKFLLSKCLVCLYR